MTRLLIWLALIPLLTLTRLPPYAPDIAPVVNLTQRRLELRRFLFASNNLPTLLPDADMTVYLANGETSTIRIHEASNTRGVLIYHTGHLGEMPTDTFAIGEFVRAGYTVYVVDMPAPPHERFADMPAIGSPVRYFLEPTLALVNWLEARGIEQVIMVGLSGGGWTTTLVAALDPRLVASYPVAGSIPLGMRVEERDAGDWEQTLPELYAIASYEELYMLGASNGRQLQIRNVEDDCCFAGTDTEYRVPVQTVTPTFDVWLDYAYPEHGVSQWAVRVILGDLMLLG